MCTIMTTTKAQYLANKIAMDERIRSDMRQNDDGFSLVFLDSKVSEDIIIRTLSKEHAMANIHYLMENAVSDSARLFLHCRAATTRYKGVLDVHAFQGGRTLIMHNGVLRSAAAQNMDVDSMILAEVTRISGPGALMQHLQTNMEFYANVFAIQPDSGGYTVLRRTTGTLFTDGKGNYSTNAVGEIDQPVPFNYEKNYEGTRRGTQIYGSYYSSLTGSTYRETSSKWKEWNDRKQGTSATDQVTDAALGQVTTRKLTKAERRAMRRKNGTVAHVITPGAAENTAPTVLLPGAAGDSDIPASRGLTDTGADDSMNQETDMDQQMQLMFIRNPDLVHDYITFEDFQELMQTFDWDTNGVPPAIWFRLSVEQARWCNQNGWFKARSNDADILDLDAIGN